MILHRTYSFDADKFHRDLEHRIVSHSKINFDSLYQIATQIAEHPSEIIRQVFEDIRYDDDWLHGELKEPNRWYMISLASVLEPSPPLAIMSRNVLPRELLVH